MACKLAVCQKAGGREEKRKAPLKIEFAVFQDAQARSCPKNLLRREGVDVNPIILEHWHYQLDVVVVVQVTDADGANGARSFAESIHVVRPVVMRAWVGCCQDGDSAVIIAGDNDGWLQLRFLQVGLERSSSTWPPLPWQQGVDWSFEYTALSKCLAGIIILDCRERKAPNDFVEPLASN